MARSAHELELMRKWVQTWKEAGPWLEEVRRRDIENADTQQAVRELFGMVPWPHFQPKRTSGLVEQQAWFAKLRRQQSRASQ